MTGWIRYNICDKSGGGYKTDKWVYEPWLCEEDDDGVRDHIVSTRESWAIHAESYSFRFEINATPPRDVVEREIKRREDRIALLSQSITNLTEDMALYE